MNPDGKSPVKLVLEQYIDDLDFISAPPHDMDYCTIVEMASNIKNIYALMDR